MTAWAVISPVANEIVVGGLALAGLYALTAVGFTIIYKATRGVNFAQGAFAVVAAYLYWYYNTTVGLDQVLSVCASAASCFVLGALTYTLIVRRVSGSDEFSIVVTTLGLALVIEAVIPLIFGSTPKIITLGGTTLSSSSASGGHRSNSSRCSLLSARSARSRHSQG